MSCMKCGRDIKEGQVFCDSCLETMAKYPVKPNIAIQLPGKKDFSAPRKSAVRRKQPPTPEEKLRKVKRRLKTVTILWLITLLLLAATVYPTVEYFIGRQQLLPGQNYSTHTSTEPKEP